MFKPIDKGRPAQKKYFEGDHRFEHWRVDNQIYFITCRVRGRFPAFASDEAKAIFWDRFTHYAREYGYVPCVTSLIPNHYHTLGYLNVGRNLGPMMQRIHGSVAKLVNDTLDARITPFWWDHGQQGYFDGCIRDEDQFRRAYRYTLIQGVRHRLVRDWNDYPHTRVGVSLEAATRRAHQKRAFLEGVPYKRYQNKSSVGPTR